MRTWGSRAGLGRGWRSAVRFPADLGPGGSGAHEIVKLATGQRSAILAAVVLTLACASPARAAGPPPPSFDSLAPAAREKLATGAPAVIAADPGGGWIRAAVAVDEGAEAIWRVMVDCPGAPEFVPGLRSCRVIESDGDTSLLEHRAKPFALLPEMTYVFRERREPLRTVHFERVSGSLREMAGRWDLRPRGADRTVVWYTVTLDPGFLVPDWLVRRSLSKKLPELLESLKRRVEGGG